MNDPEMEAIWQRHETEIQARVRLLERATKALLDNNLDDALRQESIDAAHKLAGLLGMFGRDVAGAAASVLETGLQHQSPDFGALAQAVTELREGLRGDQTAPAPAQRAARPAARRVLLVDDDPVFTAVFEVAARGRSIEVASAKDLREADALRRRDPGALLFLDLGLPDGREAVWAFLARQVGTAGAAPVVVLSATPAMEDRMEAARHGAHAFLAKSADGLDLMDEVERLLEGASTRSGDVVVLDSAGSLSAVARSALSPAGLTVHAAPEPEAFWLLVQEHHPDVIILQAAPGRTSGIDVARAIRRERALPQPHIILVGVRPHGIDADGSLPDVTWLRDPLDPRDLASAVSAQMDLRSRLRSDEYGPSPWHEVEAQATELRRHAHAAGQAITVAAVRLHPLDATPDAPPPATLLTGLAAAITETLEGEALVATAGTEALVVLAAEVAPERLEARLGEIASTVPGPSGGVTSYTINAQDARKGIAWAALVDAAYAGTRPPMPARAAEGGTPPVDPDAVDVVLIEDDATVQDVIREAAEGRGWKVRVFGDGASALEALTGSPAAVRPRLILLDINLPALDGLTVLRRLQASAAVEAPIVMLSRRAREDEVLESLENGATDHIAKPFSIKILLEKMHKWLGGP